MHSQMVSLPDVPMVSECEPGHLEKMVPDGTRTYFDVREEFLLDVATISGRSLTGVARVVEKMRGNVHTYPSEFTDAAMEFIDRLYAEAVAQRLLGKITK